MEKFSCLRIDFSRPQKFCSRLHLLSRRKWHKTLPKAGTIWLESTFTNWNKFAFASWPLERSLAVMARSASVCTSTYADFRSFADGKRHRGVRRENRICPQVKLIEPIKVSCGVSQIPITSSLESISIRCRQVRSNQKPVCLTTRVGYKGFT